MRHMKLNSHVKQTKTNKRQVLQESGQTLHEVLIASSILAITVSGFSSGIIRSNNITHQASLRKSAESVIANDLESNVKRRFYTFRCKQGPCKDAIEENDKSLMYYEPDDSSDKNKFKESCKNRILAKELLGNNKDLGEENERIKIPTDGLAYREGIEIFRRISYGDNENQATVEYEAEKDSEVIATVQTILVPNAVHWCS